MQETKEKSIPNIYTDQDEFELMVRVVMSEAGNQPLDGKIAVAETIINRLQMEGFPKTIREVIMQPSQYSTADNGTPNDDCRQAVISALENSIYPDNMVYFRTSHYHDFGKPFEQIGDHYFSLK